jgi:TIR domain
MADIFLSYSSADKSIVKQIATLLESRGWTTWWDRQIPIGERYDTVIEKELHKAGCVVVIWTQQSINSEWVKNEAADAAQREILVPVVLEELTIPLAFRRIEAAMLTDWKGESDHPELNMLFHSIQTILDRKKENGSGENPGNNVDGKSEQRSKKFFHNDKTSTWKLVSKPAVYIPVGVGLLLTLWLLFNNSNAGPSEKNVTVRVFDWKKNPVTQGEVKIYLNEYIRTQSLDKMGQALFTGIPAQMMKASRKIEVSSPGYSTMVFDTLLGDKPMELTLPLSTVIFIRGKVKTASEQPIRGVEVNIEGTRYYALSITDGSYVLRVEEYTLGDEITLTTSHPGYDDKTVSIRIVSPDMTNQDIFLNPVSH